MLEQTREWIPISRRFEDAHAGVLSRWDSTSAS